MRARSLRRFNPFRAVRRSIRLQFLLTLVVCAFGAMLIPLPIDFVEVELHRTPLDYGRGMERIDDSARAVAQALDGPSRGADAATVRRLLDAASGENNAGPLTARLLDREGRELLTTAARPGGAVDVARVLETAATLRADPARYPGRGDYVVAYAVARGGEPGYLLVSGAPKRQHVWCLASSIANGAWPFLFVGLFYLATRRKLAQLRATGAGLAEIAAGRLEHRVPEQSEDEFGELARNVNAMADELQRKHEAERRAERTKEELIASVSHDLRTPLTSITGYLDLVRRGRYDGPAQLGEYVGVAHAKAEQLHRMVEDLFEYVRLTDHDVRLARRVVCVNDLVAQLASEYVPLCEAAGLALETALAPRHVPLAVDPDRLVRVLDNLLSNAIKYGRKPGRVRVSLRDAGASVQIAVENPGPALAREELSRLFDRFYRVDAARSSAVRGSGLGLAIAKSIVELHGGEIWAESEAGVVRVRVSLPKYPADA